jgi:HK97 family phage prohead protease
VKYDNKTIDLDLQQAKYNDEEKSIEILFVTGARDREGDVMLIGGIDTTNHRKNPQVLYEHGKSSPWPLGKAEDRDGNYTVVLDEDRGIGTAKVYLADTSEAEICYNLYKKGYLRAGSIGFRPLKVARIPAGNGYPEGHFIEKSELTEFSLCKIPINAECVLGKSLTADEEIFLEGIDNIMIKAEDNAVPEQPEEEKLPHGSKCLQKCHDLHVKCKSEMDSEEEVEQPQVAKCLKKCHDALHKSCKAMSDMHEKCYGKALGDYPDEEEDEREEKETKEGDKQKITDKDDEGDDDGEKSLSDAQFMSKVERIMQKIEMRKIETDNTYLKAIEALEIKINNTEKRLNHGLGQ